MKIDALGLACPLPVIKAKQAIKESPGDEIVVLVDNEVATENLRKMADSMSLHTDIKKVSDEEYHVTITGTPEKAEEEGGVSTSQYAVAITSDEMGGGDRELGTKLMESYIYSLTEQDVLPEYVICYNAGVRMTTENEKTIEDLKTLESKGVNVVSCGLCLDFYGLKEQVKVGTIGNMYLICELMRKHYTVRP